MSDEKKWPKWVRLLYYQGSDTSIKGYEGCANNATMLIDIFDRLKIRMIDIVEMKVNDRKLSEEELIQFFRWLREKRKEIEENEKRKKSEEKTKDINQGSRA